MQPTVKHNGSYHFNRKRTIFSLSLSLCLPLSLSIWQNINDKQTIRQFFFRTSTTMRLVIIFCYVSFVAVFVAKFLRFGNLSYYYRQAINKGFEVVFVHGLFTNSSKLYFCNFFCRCSFLWTRNVGCHMRINKFKSILRNLNSIDIYSVGRVFLRSLFTLNKCS